MKLFNTMSRTKEDFKPLVDGSVGIYSCGPTVYDRIHIGNLRAFFFDDIVRRTFEYLDHNVNHVINITDVGELSNDGEDKIVIAVKRKNLPVNKENMLIVAAEYIELFKNDIQKANIKTPHHMPRASEHIAEDIEIIQRLEQNDLAYTTSDGVYFDTAKFPNYDHLAGASLKDETHARIAGNSEKKDYRDFALWKFNPEQGWDTPWGKGFPGWHIECSGMSMKYLGETFDIHTGGIEHIGTHHTNEIAQSEGATGKHFVNYWLHNDHLLINNKKMSKSEGTMYTLGDIEEKGFSAMDMRYFYLQAHYRSPQNFTWEALQASKNGLDKLYRKFAALPNDTGNVNQEFKKLFIEKLSDDFNTPQALAVMHDMMKSDISDHDKRSTLLNFDQVLGLRIGESV